MMIEECHQLIHFDDVTKENIKGHNPNWPQIPDHPNRILIIGGSGSWKTNSLFNLINHQPDIDKSYFNVKDLYHAKYQLLINKRQNTVLKHLNGSKAFIEYSNDINDIYKNIEYNPNKEHKILLVFDMIADMLTNKKLNPIATELFIRGRKLNISLVFITQSYFAVPKNIRLNIIHYFNIKIQNKRELQQIAFNKSLNIDFRGLINLYKKCNAKPYSLLVIDTSLALDNPSCFGKNFSERI